MSFHDVRFPTGISLGASGGPERRTDIVVLGSGFEERNSRWQDSRRAYDAGYGVRSLNDLHELIAFFEERRGKLYAFRWRDPADWKSCPPEIDPAPTDCELGIGDSATDVFQIAKNYGTGASTYQRAITKPVAGTVRIAVDAVEQVEGAAFLVDHATGQITFQTGFVPEVGERVTAGFEFDVPVRFDTDKLEIDVRGFRHGAVPNIPIVEVRQ